MKKFLYSLLALSVVLSLSSCASTKGGENMERPVIIGMANPFIDHENIDGAIDAVGFPISLPSSSILPTWVGNTVYRSSVVNMKLIEVIYSEDDTYNREIRIRKGIVDKEDISGDYNDYDKEAKLTIDNKEVSCFGNEEVINLAMWSDGEYKYSIHSTDGFDLETLELFIKDIK